MDDRYNGNRSRNRHLNKVCNVCEKVISGRHWSKHVKRVHGGLNPGFIIGKDRPHSRMHSDKSLVSHQIGIERKVLETPKQTLNRDRHRKIVCNVCRRTFRSNAFPAHTCNIDQKEQPYQSQSATVSIQAHKRGIEESHHGYQHMSHYVASMSHLAQPENRKDRLAYVSNPLNQNQSQSRSQNQNQNQIPRFASPFASPVTVPASNPQEEAKVPVTVDPMSKSKTPIIYPKRVGSPLNVPFRVAERVPTRSSRKSVPTSKNPNVDEASPPQSQVSECGKQIINPVYQTCKRPGCKARCRKDFCKRHTSSAKLRTAQRVHNWRARMRDYSRATTPSIGPTRRRKCLANFANEESSGLLESTASHCTTNKHAINQRSSVNSASVNSARKLPRDNVLMVSVCEQLARLIARVTRVFNLLIENNVGYDAVQKASIAHRKQMESD